MRFLSSHSIFRALALYGMFVFSGASTVTALAASTQNSAASLNGIWVKLCATGGLTFISFDAKGKNEGKNENQTPSSHAQACHAADRRAIHDMEDGTDSDDG